MPLVTKLGRLSQKNHTLIRLQVKQINALGTGGTSRSVQKYLLGKGQSEFVSFRFFCDTETKLGGYNYSYNIVQLGLLSFVCSQYSLQCVCFSAAKVGHLIYISW